MPDLIEADRKRNYTFLVCTGNDENGKPTRMFNKGKISHVQRSPGVWGSGEKPPLFELITKPLFEREAKWLMKHQAKYDYDNDNFTACFKEFDADQAKWVPSTTPREVDLELDILPPRGEVDPVDVRTKDLAIAADEYGYTGSMEPTAEAFTAACHNLRAPHLLHLNPDDYVAHWMELVRPLRPLDPDGIKEVLLSLRDKGYYDCRLAYAALNSAAKEQFCTVGTREDQEWLKKFLKVE